MNKQTKRILTVASLVLLLALAAAVYSACGKEDAENSVQASSEVSDSNTVAAPDFTVLDEDGNEVKLSDFKGKPVVLNFWATWCGYCKMEMPDFDTAYAKYPDVQFLMVNVTDGVNETVEKAKAYVETEGFSFDIFFDVKLEAVGRYGVTGYPTTYFIDKDGNAVAMQSGMLKLDILEKGIAMITE